MWMLETVNTSLARKRGGEASSLNYSIRIPDFGNYTFYANHEGCRIYLRPEEQGRRRGNGALPFRAELEHRQVQDPAAGRAYERLPSRHEQLLQQVEGARAHAAHQQEGQQSGDPAARHRLHLGPASRARRAGEEPPSLRQRHHAHTADHPERGDRKHRSRERMLR